MTAAVANDTRPTPTAGLQPPHDLEAEEAVIANAIHEPTILDEVRWLLRRDDWFSPLHRALWEAACWIQDSGEPLDFVAVIQRCKQQGAKALVVGKEVQRLIDEVPVVGLGTVRRSAERVSLLARQRRIIATCQRIASEGYGEQADPEEWAATVNARIAEAVERKSLTEHQTLREAIGEVFTEMHSEAGIRTFKTGLIDYDKRTGGDLAGDLVIIAARPGMGKSSLVMNLCEQTSDDGDVAVIFNLEMLNKTSAMRWLCRWAGVDSMKIRRRELMPEDWNKITEAAKELSRKSIYLDSVPAMRIDTIWARLKRIEAAARREGKKIGRVVVDYMQLANGINETNKHSREQQISHISQTLKQVANRGRYPVNGLSQLNRSVESRPNKRPLMSDLRESGAIEQDADAIWLLYRHQYYAEQGNGVCPAPAVGVTELEVAKQRSGATGTILLSFEGKYTRFGNLDHESRERYLEWMRNHTDDEKPKGAKRA